tara:strand:+ start:86 stop:1075 length:990 start_codon:yes stop_codon:yes gene_type:complete
MQLPLTDIDLSPLDFNVLRQPVYKKREINAPFGGSGGHDYSVIDNKFEYYREDTGQTLGVHSSTYKHDGYKPHITAVVDAINELKDNDLDCTDATYKINLPENGKKLQFEAIFPKHTIEPAVGDITQLRLRDSDSYDGTWGRRLTIDGMRLACLNGQVNAAFGFHFYSKHTKNISSDEKTSRLIKNMKNLIINFQENETVFKEYLMIQVSEPTVYDIYANTLAKSTVYYDNFSSEPDAYKPFNSPDGSGPSKTIDVLMDLYDYNRREMGSNLYAVYNAATEWATHVVNSKGKIHNVQRTREAKVQHMLKSNYWKNATIELKRIESLERT